MLASIVMLGGLLVGQTSDFAARVVRNLAADPLVVTTWERAGGSDSEIRIDLINWSQIPQRSLIGAYGPIANERTLTGNAVPQTTAVINGVLRTATGPWSPDVDVDDAGNYVVVWTAIPPHDPMAPTPYRQIYLSYNGQTPIQVSTDAGIPTPDPNQFLTSQFGHLARVTMTRDGKRIAVCWGKGGDNLGYVQVNTGAIYYRTLTVASPGSGPPSIDGLPRLVTPLITHQSYYYPPGYPGGGGGGPISYTDDSGSYYMGDIACDKKDGGVDQGYFVISFVRDHTTQAAPNEPTGLFVQGYDWLTGGSSLTPRFGETATAITGGSAHYTWPQLDCYHDASSGYGGFCLSANVGGAPLIAARYNSLGQVQASQSVIPTTVPPNFAIAGGTMGWEHDIACRGLDPTSHSYVAAWDFHYPDVYAVSLCHSLISNDVASYPFIDRWWRGYGDPNGPTFFVHPKCVIKSTGELVLTYEFGGGPSGGGTLLQARY